MLYSILFFYSFTTSMQMYINGFTFNALILINDFFFFCEFLKHYLRWAPILYRLIDAALIWIFFDEPFLELRNLIF